MARYNTSSSTNTITGTATISSPFQGAFTEFTGTAPYTVTLPTPSAFPGVNQTFYNATGGVVTVSTPNGTFTGTGGPNTVTFAVNSGNVLTVVPDGTNYIVISEDGSPLVATTGSFSGDVSITAGTTNLTPTSFSLTPGGSGGNINNVSIGATTRLTGAFTTLTANQAVTFTANTASSSTTTGSLVVTGGIGASGTITAGTVNATNLGGTISTASQPNITSATGLASIGTLTALTVTGLISAGKGVNFGGYNAISYTSSGAMGIFGHNAYADQNATNRVLQINNSYFGHFIRMYYNEGIAFHTRTSSGSAGDVLYDFATPSNQVADVAERVRILPNGNVGIGTTNPSSPLHVYQANGGSNHITLSTGFASGNSYAINPFITSVSNGGFSIRDVTNSVDRIVIQYSTGNVGIATTSPQTRLDVNGNIIARGDLFIGTKPANTLTTPNNNTSWHHIGYAGDTNYHISGSVQGDLTVGAIPGTGIIFGTATNAGDAVPVQRARIAADGGFSISNSLSVGTSASVGTSLSVSEQIRTTGNPSRSHFYSFSQGSMNGGYVHLKTNVFQTSSQMYSVLFSGHDYSGAKSIFCTLGWYNYAPSNGPISIGGNAGTHPVSAYKSSDGYTVMVMGPTGGYYTAFTLTQFYTTQGLADLTISAAASSSSSTGVY